MRKRHRAKVRFWVGWVLCAGVLGASLFVAPWLRGNETPTHSVQLTTNPDPQFGIEPGGSLASLSPTELELRLAGVKELGVTWVRFDVDWALVQPNGPNAYDWSAYDRVVAAINGLGLHALGTIDYTPKWAQVPGQNDIQIPPASSARYAAFAAAVAARYALQGLHDWEVWNEPNWSHFWPPQPDAAAYAGMLKATYASVHAADPNAVVIVGGLSSGAADGIDIDAPTFLQQLYAWGVAGFFDAVAIHPYTFPRLASDLASDSWQQIAALHNIMQENGDGAKKVWVTEYGAPTDGPGLRAAHAGTQSQSGVDHVSEAAQADILTNAVKAYKTLPYAGPFFWYDYQDVPPEHPKNAEDSYGLVRADGTPKPAFAAYQRAIAGAQ